MDRDTWINTKTLVLILIFLDIFFYGAPIKTIKVPMKVVLILIFLDIFFYFGRLAADMVVGLVGLNPYFLGYLFLHGVVAYATEFIISVS